MFELTRKYLKQSLLSCPLSLIEVCIFNVVDIFTVNLQSIIIKVQEKGESHLFKKQNKQQLAVDDLIGDVMPPFPTTPQLTELWRHFPGWWGQLQLHAKLL